MGWGHLQKVEIPFKPVSFLICEGTENKGIYSSIKLPEQGKSYLYFIKIGQGNLYKIGSTNRPFERMKEHLRYYKEDIYIYWFSYAYSKYTTLRVEDRTKEKWKRRKDFFYKQNDRFYIEDSVKSITIQVKNNFKIYLK